MSVNEWNDRIDYLRGTRDLYYNDDYLEFLVRRVWKIDRPVRLADFGCGYGYLGLKLLPYLPEGSSYTGFDSGETLVREAQRLFSNLPYSASFHLTNLEDTAIGMQFDMAMSHAFLLHVSEVERILSTMIDSVVDGGLVICFEPHWIGSMANYAFEHRTLSDYVRLGPLQKLYEAAAAENGKDGNIGLKLPILFSQAGLTDIGCRVSDKVNILDLPGGGAEQKALYEALLVEGIGSNPGERSSVIERLKSRGLTDVEALDQYQAEKNLADDFPSLSRMAYCPNVKITYGTVNRRRSSSESGSNL